MTKKKIEHLCKYCYLPLKRGQWGIGYCLDCSEEKFISNAKEYCVVCGEKIKNTTNLITRILRNGNYCINCCNNSQKLLMFKAGITCNKKSIIKLEKKLKKKGLLDNEKEIIRVLITEKKKDIKDRRQNLDNFIKTLPQYREADIFLGRQDGIMAE